jgi:colanic acid/amylovoran biosynthesis glycosyltransferase
MPGNDAGRIGYLVSQYPAASHTFIRREVEALRSRGLEIETFSVRRPSPLELKSPRDRAEFARTFYLLPANTKTMLSAHVCALVTRPVAYLQVLMLALRHRVPGFRALTWAFFHFAEAIRLARELESRQITRLHNHFANSGATVGMLASSFLKLPWSITLHGISETDYPAGLLLSAKIQAASFVACVSEFGRAQAMRISPPECWHKLLLIRCALNLDDLPQRRLSDPGRPARLICVGRLSAEKGHLGLLEAFAKVIAAGIDAELVLVGDGPEKEKISQTVTSLALNNKIRLAGLLTEDATLNEIADADVLVIASFMEGLPVVLMEAMGIGLPVVATRVAGIPELVVEGKNGLLFSPANWDELAGHLVKLCSDAPLRNRLGRAGREIVFESHNVTSAFDSLFEHFSRVPNGQPNWLIAKDIASKQ